MNKPDLISIIKQRAGNKLSVVDVESAVESLFVSLVDSLKAGQRIEIRGFGVFAVHESKERKGRNPKTGEVMMVPPKRVVRFKAGKELRERVNY